MVVDNVTDSLSSILRGVTNENEVLRRAAAYLSQANLPGKGSTRS